MTTSMSSAFTAPERRKKVITYGKASRLAPIPPPTASSDAPSPERPRKQPATSIGSLKKGGGSLKAIDTPNYTRTTTASPDIFDVPSDDEFVTHPAKPTKKLPTKHRTTQEDTKLRTQNGQQQSKVVEHMRKYEAAGSVAPVVKRSQNVQPPKTAPATMLPFDNTSARTARRGKTPQSVADVQHDIEKMPRIQPQAVKAKAIPHTSTPELPLLKATKTTKTNATFPNKWTATKPSAKPPHKADIFDLPSSDDEVHMPTPKPARRAPVALRKDTAKALKPSHADRRQEPTESDDSETLKKRKRRGSVSSIVATKPIVELRQDGSLSQRNRKYQKKQDSISPGHDQPLPPTTSTVQEAQPVPRVVTKPRRTRLRTVPVITRPPIAKGQSSPAKLHNMLSNNLMFKPSPIAEASETTTLEDETMYEIPDSLTTPVRPSSNAASGIVTPRQKALFGSLLGTFSSTTTPMPSISKLQLTGRKPALLLGALSRSKSGLTPSTQSQKTKLIASLKPAHSSSDVEDSGSESETGSDEEIEEPTPKATAAHRRTDHAFNPRPITKLYSDNLDVENEVAAESQTSQSTSGFGMRPKFTYAKSRSYLEEANPEDALLMSMDLDDAVTFGSQTRDSQTEDEEEASQVRPNHELKRTGHNTKFQWDNQMLIDDITIKSASGIRRSTMLELVTKMADGTFAHDLLESSLADQFFENIASSNEIIFDFAVAVATIFLLRDKPSYTSLNQAYRSDVMSTLVKLLDNEYDIVKIAKNRKTNLSNIAKEAVVAFRSTVTDSTIWPTSTLDTVSPQLVALKALDLLIIGLRNTGNVEAIISQDAAAKLVDIAVCTSERCKARGADTEAKLILSTVFSALEAVSLAKQKQIVWSTRMLQHLAGAMPISFQVGDALTVTMAVKLCMKLTNNKPKACQQFSDPTFVQSLVQSIVDRTKLLHAGLEEAQRAEALDTLILSLGAMINLTEHSDQARVNVDDGDQLIEALVTTFMKGSVQSTQAVSIEESQSSVAVGYLSVLLGNMCLNKSIKRMIQEHLPGQKLTILVDKIKEFVQVHEHANRKAKQFEGEEGQETWQNYTARIMLVVEQLADTRM